MLTLGVAMFTIDNATGERIDQILEHAQVLRDRASRFSEASKLGGAAAELYMERAKMLTQQATAMESQALAIATREA